MSDEGRRDGAGPVEPARPTRPERSVRPEGPAGPAGPARPVRPQRPVRSDGRFAVGRLRPHGVESGRPWPADGPGAERPPTVAGPVRPGGRAYWLTGSAAELLVTGGRVSPPDTAAADSATRLARLLAAAGPAGAHAALDPAREEAALAAFRAARRTDRRVTAFAGLPRGGLRSTRRAIRLTVGAVACVIALSGVAVAVAEAGGGLPMPGQGSGSTLPAGRRASSSALPSIGEAGRSATTVPGVNPSPGSAATPTGTPSAPAPGSLAWCEQYHAAGAKGARAAPSRKLVRSEKRKARAAARARAKAKNKGKDTPKAGQKSKAKGKDKGPGDGKVKDSRTTWRSGWPDPQRGTRSPSGTAPTRNDGDKWSADPDRRPRRGVVPRGATPVRVDTARDTSAA